MLYLLGNIFNFSKFLFWFGWVRISFVMSWILDWWIYKFEFLFHILFSIMTLTLHWVNWLQCFTKFEHHPHTIHSQHLDSYQTQCLAHFGHHVPFIHNTWASFISPSPLSLGSKELIQMCLMYSIIINVISQWDSRLYSARGVKFVVNFFLAFGSIEINPISRGTLKHSLPLIFCAF